MDRLLRLLVAPLGCRAQLPAVAIQAIVGDLKCQAKIFAIAREPRQIGACRFGHLGTDPERSEDQRAGFRTWIISTVVRSTVWSSASGQRPPTKPKAPAARANSRIAYTTSCGIAPRKMLSLIYLALPAASNSPPNKALILASTKRQIRAVAGQNTNRLP